MQARSFRRRHRSTRAEGLRGASLDRKMAGPAEGPSPRPPPRSFLAERGRTAFHRTRCAQRRMTQETIYLAKRRRMKDLTIELEDRPGALAEMGDALAGRG